MNEFKHNQINLHDPVPEPGSEKNRPVNVEALEQQKDGVLLLAGLQSCAVGLHGHESMFDQRYPQVVQLSSIDSVKNAPC